MTRYLLLFGSYRLVFHGVSSLTRGRICHLYMLLATASAVSLGFESLGTRDHILRLRFETSLYVASYDSQGYGRGIRPRLHTHMVADGSRYIVPARTAQKTPLSLLRVLSLRKKHVPKAVA
jgi:hypothetical protein